MTRVRGSIATPGQSIFIGVVTGLIGLVVLGFAARLVVQKLAYLAGAETASASVVRMEQVGDVYHPVVSFTTSDGRQVTFTDPLGSNPPSNKVGDTVQVIYPTGVPEKAQVNSFLDLWFSPLALTAFGAFFLVTGIAGLSSGTRRRRAQNPAA